MNEKERIKRLEQAVARMAAIYAEHLQKDGENKLSELLRELSAQLDPECNGPN